MSTHCIQQHHGAGSDASSDGSSTQPTASHHSTDRTDSSAGGLWQRGNSEPSKDGTWDFDTAEPARTSNQPTAESTSSEAETQQSSEKQMLYIQMEFCPRTLKQVLLAGPIEEADAWQVCCAGLCCAVLCWAGLRCAGLCCAALCCAVLCCALLCCAVLCLHE